MSGPRRWDSMGPWARARYVMDHIPAFATVWGKLAWMILSDPAIRAHLFLATGRRVWWSLVAMVAALSLGLVRGVVMISISALVWELSTMVLSSLSVGLAGPQDPPDPTGPEDPGQGPPPPGP